MPSVDRASTKREPAPADLGLVDALVQLSFLIQATLARVAQGHELSVIQVRLFGVLRDRGPGMHELARLLGLDKSSITGLVDRAERRGLVERNVSARDRRSFEVHLTPAGRSLARRVAQEFEHEARRLAAGLSTREQELLSTLITRILLDDAAEQGVELFPV
jgi:MarR family transcriptional regulator, lower aerobic nicotinate degradation pathway regulator